MHGKTIEVIKITQPLTAIVVFHNRHICQFFPDLIVDFYVLLFGVFTTCISVRLSDRSKVTKNKITFIKNFLQ